MSHRTIKALVSGRVQGVSYREHVRQQAQRWGITGHAINLADGRVEVIASGESTAIAELIDALWQGSPAANVIGVEVEDATFAAPADFTTG
ncbi:acylphosphatase [Salinicola rhizosphaerae]|uniref:acylphosphatase n=1 Tax=Salinicola rhizosphaerae TaxID=1443141 RepID=A0ABQ3DRP4_9GAMM|nr:acylphosphatase [Salinicola rhizosphaerae]GHB09482.1 acylphosphatase [Salinicola rhizosphaerae]